MMGLFRKKQKKYSNPELLSELVLSSIHDAVIIIDKEGLIRFSNPASERLLGLKKDKDLLGVDYRTVLKLVDSENVIVDNEDINPVSVALKTNKYYETRNFSILKAPNNEAVPVMISITTMGDAGSDRIISLRNIARELREEQAKDEFISIASHEMRTPVASIEGYLGLALNPRTANIDSRAREYLEKAHEASTHLGRLFRDLLDTTKSDAGKLKAEFTPVELEQLVKNIADGQAADITRQGLRYIYGRDIYKDTIDYANKRLGQVLYASVDIDFMREAIGNLIENSIKYTVEGTISVSVKGDDRNAYIIVSDTGIGIGDEDLPHIFQKFYRADNSDTRKIGGTGLGLYLTKQRVEAMGGKVKVESKAKKGTSFIIVLPRLSKEEYTRQHLAATSIMSLDAKKKEAAKELKIDEAGTAETTAEAAANKIQKKAKVDKQASTEESVENLSPEKLGQLKAEFAKKMQGEGKPK